MSSDCTGQICRPELPTPEVKELNESQNQWKKNCEQEQVDFKKIMEDTVREKE